jgi:thiamine-phosphate pyrophosphorylase
MDVRQPLPRLWLMTDERQGDALLDIIVRLPQGSGIVFRHYRLPPIERWALFGQVRAAARLGRHMLLLSGSGAAAKTWGADGSHGRGPGEGLRSAPAHNYREIRAAERAGADLIFLSPLYPTRSHPGGPTLGPARFGSLCRRTRLPVVALGGVNRSRAGGLIARGAYGWAGIDALGR